MTLNFAHRGGAGLYPENTLAAFRDAVARGCDGAELDVQLSKDGEVVVFHDYKLKPEICRLGGKWIRKPTPRIKDLTLDELRAFDVGRHDPASDYAKARPHSMPIDGATIPTLKEVLEITSAAKKPFMLQVEFKTSFFDRDVGSTPKALTDATVAVLRNANYLDRTIFVGFDWEGLLRAKELEPEVACWFTTMELDFLRDPPSQSDTPTKQRLRHWAETGTSPWAAGYDPIKYGGSIQKAIKAAGGDGWFPYFPDATEKAVAEAKSLGLKVGAWTVNDMSDMKTLIARGLDGICTDRPDLLAKALKQSAPST
ncbi:MAG TPA: glycerophosphodiester phosphodiesterase family protein [Rhizomicrobium sp.]|nr:glycerophosphodiester phosphodiesterase family protein [Rhizomicrobium sp.]